MNLHSYKSNYQHKRPLVVQISWYLISMTIFQTSCVPFYPLKIGLLRMYGSKIGRGLVNKPKVYIKYPWLLEIGDDVWIGEGVRIDNLALVSIGSNVCISQNAFLLTGNHDYSTSGFDLTIGQIIIENEVWVGASVVVCPKAHLSLGTVISVGSVVSGNTIVNQVYRGNPAVPIRSRYKKNVEHRVV